MKNQKIYDEYAIEGFPCHFITVEARDRYNNAIEKYCEKLKEGANDLSPWQKICRFFLILYLDVFDIALSQKKK